MRARARARAASARDVQQWRLSRGRHACTVGSGRTFQDRAQDGLPALGQHARLLTHRAQALARRLTVGVAVSITLDGRHRRFELVRCVARARGRVETGGEGRGGAGLVHATPAAPRAGHARGYMWPVLKSSQHRAQPYPVGPSWCEWNAAARARATEGARGAVDVELQRRSTEAPRGTRQGPGLRSETGPCGKPSEDVGSCAPR